MVLKISVLVIFLIILYCLASALYYLLRGNSNTRQAIIALTWRSGLSVCLFILLLLGALMGWITPHGIL